VLDERESEPLPAPLAIYIARELARALVSLHQASEGGAPLNIIKRDLSPNDIFLTSDGRVKMMGLGVAKSAAQLEQTQPGTIKGKFSYMSPEQARMEPLDQRSDVYSLGLVLREMLSGRPAFLGATDMETFQLNARAELPRLHALPDPAQAKLDWVLDNALAVARDLRYPNAQTMADELDEVLKATPLAGAEELARVLNEVFGRELAEEKSRAQNYLANN
jgi:serine/threonine-protein kinase